MVRIMAGRTVDDLLAAANRVVIRDRKWLPVSNQKTMVIAFHRRQRAYAHRRAGPHQIDRGLTSESVLLPIAGKMLFVRAPAKLARLRAFADETVDRPGIDELVAAFAGNGDLRVTLRTMDHLDAKLHREPRPVRFGLGLRGAFPDVTRKVAQ